MTAAARSRLRVVFAVYLVGLAYLVFGPTPGPYLDDVRRDIRSLETTAAPTTTTTTRTARPSPRPTTVRRGTSTTAPRPRPPVRTPVRLRQGSRLEAFLNVLLFVPFTLLLPLGWPRTRWAAVPFAVATSCGIELIQGFMSWRTQSVGDVVWNSAGACLGYACWLLLERFPRQTMRPAP